MKTFIALIAALLVLSASIASPNLVEAKRKKKSDSDLEKTLKSQNVTEADRLKALDEYVFPSVEYVRGLGEFYEDNLPSEKKPDRIMDRICASILTKISIIKDEAIYKELGEDCLDVKLPMKLRVAYIEAYSNDTSDAASANFLELAKDEIATIRTFAIADLGLRQYKPAFSTIMGSLIDPDRRVQFAAMDSLVHYAEIHKNYKDAIVTELCSQYMQRPSNLGVKINHCRQTLKQITGHDAGVDPVAWYNWWREQKIN
ncbi:MAG: hypothetical protein KDB07_09140, partial [Planctomycetes bacterium]|nr:hypothetical protein [Planctomycetota bacterium]